MSQPVGSNNTDEAQGGRALGAFDMGCHLVLLVWIQVPHVLKVAKSALALCGTSLDLSTCKGKHHDLFQPADHTSTDVHQQGLLCKPFENIPHSKLL
jgi:hypothetical protein